MYPTQSGIEGDLYLRLATTSDLSSDGRQTLTHQIETADGDNGRLEATPLPVR